MKPILTVLTLFLLTFPAFSQSLSALDSAISRYLAERDITDRTQINAAAVARLCDQQPPKACLISQAVALSEQMEESPNKTGTLRDFAVALAKAGFAAEALQTVRQIEPATSEFAKITHITVLIHLGRYAEAGGMIDQIEDAWEKVQISEKLAMALIEAGHTSQALAFAGQSRLIQADPLALTHIAGALLKSGEIDTARQVLTTAYQVALRLNDPFDKARNLRSIAVAFTQTGDVETALNVSERISDRSQKNNAQREMVGMLTQAGRLEDARRVADQIEDMPTTVTALAVIIPKLFEAGQAMEARRMIDQAQKLAAQITPLDARAGAFQDIAVALAKVGDASNARQTFEAALAAILSIEDARDQSWPLSLYARALSRIPDHEAALEMVVTMPTQELKEIAWQGIAIELAGENAANEARKVLALITNEALKSETISYVANLFAQTGNLVEAFSWSQEVSKPRQRIVILVGTAARL